MNEICCVFNEPFKINFAFGFKFRKKSEEFET